MGKTCTQLANDIESEIIREGYIKDPAVSVRLMNFKFSVLGEVSKPGNYEIKGERLTLLEALSNPGRIVELGPLARSWVELMPCR